MKLDWIFICRKCGHNLYVSDNKLIKLLKRDCPDCGEEAGDLWILSGRGIFNKNAK